MLPEFPKARKEMQAAWDAALLKGVRHGDPIVSEIPTRPQHEGRAAKYRNVLGDTKQVKYQKTSTQLVLKPEVGKGLGLHEFLEMPDSAGRDTARQMAGHLFEKMREVTTETGNVISARGEPFHYKHLLEATEKMWLEFDSNGQPRFPTVVLGPEAYAAVQKALPDWEKDPKFTGKLAEIVERKREQFREREADRRLVD